MCAGYQEYLCAQRMSLLHYKKYNTDSYRNVWSPLFRDPNGQWLYPYFIPKNRKESWGAISVKFIQSEEGIFWHERKMQHSDMLYKFPSFNTIVREASKYVDNPLLDPTCFLSPKIWTPEHQWSQKVYLQDSTIPIMQELANNKKELETIRWQELEEIVAEILRSRGMQIHIIKENPQGGRDIIARGQFIPGMEIMTIAVEVKHRPIVGRPEVQKALYQNRMFPVLMFVTSGRFTTGVIQEAQMPDNRMRLFLKDGVAIRELLQTYKFA
jgi:HJR/Mrr/RecB family endonuclease